MEISGPDLIDAGNAAAYLAGRGVFPDGAEIACSELGGGVSNVVLLAESRGSRVVLKQALPRLRVADVWEASPQRALTEARALEAVRAIAPDWVPRVLDIDDDACAFVIEAAPPDWEPWKDALLAGRVDAELAAGVGRLTGRVHAATYRDPFTESAFADLGPFDELRLDPYYRTTRQRCPEVATELADYLAAIGARRSVLVHGDLSPKNVLSGPGGAWLIDHEVAHYGDPAFDTAFMLNHLALKAIHRPASHAELEAAAGAFWEAYAAAAPRAASDDLSYVLGQVGCLMLARVAGKSPAEYLDERGRGVARAVAVGVLQSPPADLPELFARLRQAA